jgi:hypothetical protein
VAIVMFMDGVLRTETRVPIFEGLSIYRLLKAGTSVFLAVEDEKEAERWCVEHKVNEVDGFIPDSKVDKFENKDWLKIQLQQAAGQVYLVVTSDVELAKTCLENGVKVFLFLHPIYLSPKFRPDGREGRKSWLDLVNELDKQTNMLIEDKRV